MRGLLMCLTALALLALGGHAKLLSPAIAYGHYQGRTLAWPPPDVTITPPKGACTATKFKFTTRDGSEVTILADAEEVKFDFAPSFGATRDRRSKGIGTGNIADITVRNGWLYIIGRQTSVGAGTVVAAAESSKLVVDARNPAAVRILHPLYQGAVAARTWMIDGKKEEGLPPGGVARPGPNDAPEVEPPDPAEAIDPLLELIDRVAYDCGRIEGPTSQPSAQKK